MRFDHQLSCAQLLYVCMYILYMYVCMYSGHVALQHRTEDVCRGGITRILRRLQRYFAQRCTLHYARARAL